MVSFLCSAIGLFPATPGSPFLVIGSPIFPEGRIRLGRDPWFVVRAPDVSDANQEWGASSDSAPPSLSPMPGR